MADKEFLKQFSYGFEIEGFFKQGLAATLGNKGEFKWDGSVHHITSPFSDFEVIPPSTRAGCSQCTFDSSDRLVAYCDRHHARWNNEGRPAQEYASEVYTDLDECLSVLGQFKNEKTHSFNETCGLHFHIGITNGKYRQLFSVASNFDYLRQLYKEASKWCKCQGARLNRHSHFYAFWEDRFGLIASSKDTGNTTKYRFIRFHPTYKTLECRFLSPCEHKVENVRKLINSLTTFLGRDEKSHNYAIVETEAPKHAQVMFENPVPKKGKPLEIIKKLFQSDSIISPYPAIDNWEISNGISANGVASGLNIQRDIGAGVALGRTNSHLTISSEGQRRSFQSQQDATRNQIIDILVSANLSNVSIGHLIAELRDTNSVLGFLSRARMISIFNPDEEQRLELFARDFARLNIALGHQPNPPGRLSSAPVYPIWE